MARSSQGSGTPERLGAQAPGLSPEAVRAMRPVVEALRDGKNADAVRLLIEGLAHGVVPRGDAMLPWFRAAIGYRLLGQLIDAFAIHLCFYCREGGGECEDCQGSGQTGDRGVCPECLGLGQFLPAACGEFVGRNPAGKVGPGPGPTLKYAVARVAYGGV